MAGEAVRCISERGAASGASTHYVPPARPAMTTKRGSRHGQYALLGRATLMGKAPPQHKAPSLRHLSVHKHAGTLPHGSLLKDSRAVLSPRGPGRLVCQVPPSHQPGKASRKGTRATCREGEQTPPGRGTHHPRTLDGSCCPLPRSAPGKGAQMRLFSFQSLRHQGGPGQGAPVFQTITGEVAVGGKGRRASHLLLV